MPTEDRNERERKKEGGRNYSLWEISDVMGVLGTWGLSVAMERGNERRTEVPRRIYYYSLVLYRNTPALTLNSTEDSAPTRVQEETSHNSIRFMNLIMNLIRVFRRDRVSKNSLFL